MCHKQWFGRKWYVLGQVILTGWIGCMSGAISCQAQVMAHISLNTSPLISAANGPFSIDFKLIDGSIIGDANNTVTLTNFQFGVGGSVQGAPSLTGGATGDSVSGVSLTDSDFLSEFTQSFQAGDSLQFDMSLTTNVDPGIVPDQFTFTLLDGTGTELPTLGPNDVLMAIDIISDSPPIQVYGSDPARTGPLGPLLDSPVVTPLIDVPEPNAFTLLVGAIIGGLGGILQRGLLRSATKTWKSLSSSGLRPSSL